MNHEALRPMSSRCWPTWMACVHVSQCSRWAQKGSKNNERRYRAILIDFGHVGENFIATESSVNLAPYILEGDRGSVRHCDEWGEWERGCWLVVVEKLLSK
jgi:hypothetical protein